MKKVAALCLSASLTPLATMAGFVEPPMTSLDFTEESYTDAENIMGFALGDFIFGTSFAVDALGSAVVGNYGVDVIPGKPFAGSLADGEYSVYLVHMDNPDEGKEELAYYAAEVDFGAPILGIAFTDSTFNQTVGVLQSASPNMKFRPNGVSSNFHEGNDELTFSNARTLDFLNGVTEKPGLQNYYMNQAFLFFAKGSNLSPSVVPEPSALLGGVTFLVLGLLIGRRR